MRSHFYKVQQLVKLISLEKSQKYVLGGNYGYIGFHRIEAKGSLLASWKCYISSSWWWLQLHSCVCACVYYINIHVKSHQLRSVYFIGSVLYLNKSSQVNTLHLGSRGRWKTCQSSPSSESTGDERSWWLLFFLIGQQEKPVTVGHLFSAVYWCLPVWCVYYFPGAAIINYHILGDLKQQREIYFLTV